MIWKDRYLKACSDFNKAEWLYLRGKCGKRQFDRSKRRIRSLLREVGAI